MGRPNLSRETKFSGANGEREKTIFPVQLITSKIGNHTRLIPTLLKVLIIHTYIPCMHAPSAVTVSKVQLARKRYVQFLGVPQHPGCVKSALRVYVIHPCSTPLTHKRPCRKRYRVMCVLRYVIGSGKHVLWRRMVKEVPELMGRTPQEARQRWLRLTDRSRESRGDGGRDHIPGSPSLDKFYLQVTSMGEERRMMPV